MSYLPRRNFLRATAVATAALSSGPIAHQALARAATSQEALSKIVDTNVYLSSWPFRRLPASTADELVQRLRRRGVVEAWTGSFDGVFHKDIATANAHLADQCRRFGDGMLVPFGSINPKLPDWPEDLRRCQEEHHMSGVRLHPNYHGYTLSDPEFRRVLTAAEQRGLLVQIVAWMEDERHQHPLMPLSDVDLAPLKEALRKVPDLQVVVLNGFRVPGGSVFSELAEVTQISFDIALLDVIDGLGEFLEKVPVQRVLFGSYSPMFYFESSRLKLDEAALDGAAAQAILFDNARSLRTSTKHKEVSR